MDIHYDTPEIEEFFKGKEIIDSTDLPEAKLVVKSIQDQEKEVLDGLKQLDKESLKNVVRWIEKQKQD